MDINGNKENYIYSLSHISTIRDIFLAIALFSFVGN